VLATTAVALVQPWSRIPRPVGALVPVLDIAAIGVGAIDPSGWPCSPLLVLPDLGRTGPGEASGAVGVARAVRGEAGELVGATLARQDVTEFMRALHVKDEFAASVSHELRTPRTSIRGYLDLVLDEDGLSDETRPLLRVAARNGDPLQRLVVDLLHTPHTDADSMHVGPRTGRPCGGRA
jgi:signal transduction histidine kinase